MEGEREKGRLERSRGTWGKHPRATGTNDGGGCGVRETGRESGERVGATTMERAKLREGEMRERERERVAAKGSSIRIPRHAPSYHIDLAIVTILSSPAMLGCTIAAGGRGMPKSEESRAGEGQREERGWRLRGRRSRSYRMVYHATPMRGCGPPRG